MPITEPIRIRKEIKEELKRLKIHPRETYDDVISRLIDEYKKSRKEGKLPDKTVEKKTGDALVK